MCVCVCVCACVCVWAGACMCVYPAAFSALYAHSPGAFVWSEPIHLLTLVSPASCMTIQAIKPRVEHTLFNSYHKKNRSKEDECLPSQGMKRGRAGGGEKKKKNDKGSSHNSLPHAERRHDTYTHHWWRKGKEGLCILQRWWHLFKSWSHLL